FAGATTANFTAQKENHLTRTIKKNQEEEGAPGAKDLSNPKPSPVKEPPRQGFDPRRIDVPVRKNRAQDSLDEAMVLYRKSTPAYANMDHCIDLEYSLKMLDSKVLDPAFQVALEICTILGESITKENPRPEWQRLYVRVRTDCGPTATVQQIGELVKRLVNTGVKLD